MSRGEGRRKPAFSHTVVQAFLGPRPLSLSRALAYLWKEALPDLAELFRLTPLEQRVHVAAGLVPPHQLAEPVQVQLPLKARVLVFWYVF